MSIWNRAWGAIRTLVDTSRLDQSPDLELPTRLATYAQGVPQGENPLLQRLSPDAYVIIQRSDATAHAVNKLAKKLSRYRLVVETTQKADSEKVRELQTECVDRIEGVPDALHWLAWGVVEGWRAMRVNGFEADGWIIPDLRNGGRRRSEANGNMTLEIDTKGQEVLYRSEQHKAIQSNQVPPGRLSRDRYILFKPGASSSSEGSYELAFRLYNIAIEWQETLKQTGEYLRRHGNPFWYLASALASIRPTSLAARQSKMAEAVLNAPKGGLVLDPELKGIDSVEPKGVAQAFLLQMRERLRGEAMQAILDQELTSSTKEAGPTGSSTEAANTEDEAVDSVAIALSDAIDRDLRPFIARHNPALMPAGVRWRLKLSIPAKPKQPTAQDIRSLYDTGEPVWADDLYEAHSAKRPPGVPDVIKKPVPMPLFSFGSMGSSDQPNKAPTDITGNPKPSGEPDDADPDEPKDEPGGDTPDPAPNPPPAGGVDRERLAAQAAEHSAQAVTLAARNAEAMQLLQAEIERLRIRFERGQQQLAGGRPKLPDDNKALDELVREAVPSMLQELTRAWKAYLPKAWAGQMEPRFPVQLANEFAKLRALADMAGVATMAAKVGPAGEVLAEAQVAGLAQAFRESARLPFRDAVENMARAVGIPPQQAAVIRDEFDKRKFQALKPLKTEFQSRAKALLDDYRGRVGANQPKPEPAPQAPTAPDAPDQPQAPPAPPQTPPAEPETPPTAPDAPPSVPPTQPPAPPAAPGADEPAPTPPEQPKPPIAPPGGSEEEFVKFAEGQNVPANMARTTMRNETSVAYGQGLERQMNEAAQFLGGWKYQTAGDQAVRPEHQALDGKIFPLDRRELMPPNGYNCRCVWFPVGREDADKVLSPAEIEELTKSIPEDWRKSPLAMGEGAAGTPETLSTNVTYTIGRV